jgi:hypothetical protein
MQRLADAWRRLRPGLPVPAMRIVYRPGLGASATTAVAAGVRAQSWQEFVRSL